MKLIDNWKKAYQMLSVQAMALATTILGSWEAIPADLKTHIPQGIVHAIAMGLLVAGIAGRLIAQPKVSQ